MNSKQNILSRRSIRKFKPLKIQEETLLEIIKLAQYAPSAVNKQPWHFIIVDDRSLFEKVMEIHPNSRMLATASHAIIICGDEQLQHDDGYWIADCGAATQNLLLAAHGMGIGSCWVGLYPREKRMKSISELFRTPDHIKPFALVALGYPDEEKSIPDRFKPDRIFRNSWDNPF